MTVFFDTCPMITEMIAKQEQQNGELTGLAVAVIGLMLGTKQLHHELRKKATTEEDRISAERHLDLTQASYGYLIKEIESRLDEAEHKQFARFVHELTAAITTDVSLYRAAKTEAQGAMRPWAAKGAPQG